jgi:hypothetical protein
MSKPAKTFEEVRRNLTEVVTARESGKLGILSAIAWPDFSRYLVRAIANDASKGLGDLALASMAYKAANGTYPARLEDLRPDYLSKIPMDPSDGQPLKIKHADGGLDLYSMGPGPELERDKIEGPIRFYLGHDVYEEYRVKPALEERLKETQQKKKSRNK